jgi:hypothetical protein
MGLTAFLLFRATKNKPGIQPRAQNFAYTLLFMAITVACGWLLHRFGLDIFKPRNPANSGFLIIFAAAYWCGLATEFWQRRHAGALLLDIAPASGRNVFRGFAVLGLVTSVGPLFGSPTGRWQAFWQMGLTAGFLFWATGRFQVRDRGTLTPMTLVRWDKVQAYSWAAPGQLHVAIASRFPWCRRINLQVPLEHVPAFDRFFAGHALQPSAGL